MILKINARLFRFCLSLFIGCLFFFAKTYGQAPVINSFSPASGKIGTEVTILGTNFDAQAQNNIVRFGAVKAVIKEASATKLVVVVPVQTSSEPISILNLNTHLAASTVLPFFPKYTLAGYPSLPDVPEFGFGDIAGGLGIQSFSVRDLNNDDQAEIVFVSTIANTVNILPNSRSVTGIVPAFKRTITLKTGLNPYDVKISDIDGDGKPDLIISNGGDNTISIFRNIATTAELTQSSFAEKITLPAGEMPQKIEISDINQDGKPDLVVANKKSNSVSIFQNTSQGTISFAPKIDIATGGLPISLYVGDANGDRFPELVVVSKEIDKASIFRNTAIGGSITAGSFAPRVDFGGIDEISAAILADMDNDQKPELLIVGTTSSLVAVCKNKSSAASINSTSFDAPVLFIIGYYSVRLDIGDMNADGKPDIIAHNDQLGYNSTYLENSATTGIIDKNSFKQQNYLNVSNATNIIACNIDNDDMPDWIFNNTNKGSISYIQGKIKSAVPLINSFLPIAANTGAKVTITGENFNIDPKLNIVYFGATKANILSATATQLQVEVPVGAKYGAITVLDVYSKLSSGSTTFFTPIYNGKQEILQSDFSLKGTLPSRSKLNPIIADIDGDGKPDLIVANDADNTSANSFAVYRNTSANGNLSSGSFSSKTEVFLPGITKIKVADFDGDGRQDVVVGTGNGTSVFMNKSVPDKIVFSARIPLGDIFTSYRFWSVTDLNADGMQDVGIIDSDQANFLSNYTITIGKPVFKANFPVAARLAQSSLNMEAIDLDGDRLPELLIHGDYQQLLSIYRNVTPVGVQSPFPSKIDINVGSGVKNFSFADLDGDDKLDIVIVNTVANTMTILRNTSQPGTISFSAAVVFSVTEPRAVSIADMDGDSKPDICLISGNTTLVIYKNGAEKGNITAASFANKTNITTGTTLFGLTTGDLDGDGKPDLILNDGENPVILIKNTPVTNDIVLTATAGRQVFKILSKFAPVPLVVDAGLTVATSLTPTKAKVFIKDNYTATEDKLALIVNAATMGALTATFNSEMGELVITAAAGTTAGQWQAALSAVTYTNSNITNPMVKDRKIGFEIYDEQYKSNLAEKTIGIDFTNQSGANLEVLSPSSGTLIPDFKPDITSYRVYVGAATNSITLFPRVTDQLAALTINGVNAVSGSTSTALPLVTGTNKITMVVLAKDGITSKTYDLEVIRSDKTAEIVFRPLANVKYGAADFNLVATSTIYSVIPIVFTSNNPTVAGVVDGRVRIYNAGTAEITASQAFSGLDPVKQTLIVEKVPLIASVIPAKRVYGAENPLFEVNYSGFVKDENYIKITKQPQFSTTATKNSLAGSYPITSFGAEAANYEISYVGSTLSVMPPFDISAGINPIIFTLDADGKKNLSLKDITKTITYGGSNPSVSIQPSTLTCANLGKQIITVSAIDGNPLNTGVTFNNPSGVAVDKAGNIYVGDSNNNLIRKITKAGLVTTFSGTGLRGSVDGNIATASFDYPMGLTFDDDGNLYVAERGTFAYQGNIRKISPSGEVTTIRTNENPTEVAVDKYGNLYFVCSSIGSGQDNVFKISATGVISKVTTAVSFSLPFSISMDKDSYYLYVGDFGRNGERRVRRINPEGTVEAYYGGRFQYDNGSNNLYYGEGNPVSVLAGQPGEVYVAVASNSVSRIPNRDPYYYVSSAAGLNVVEGMAMDNEGNIIVADAGSHSIKKITPEGKVSTIAGNGNPGDNNGDLSTGNNGWVFSLQIPVTVKSRPEILSALGNITIPINSAGKGEVPDFTKTTLVKNSCSAVKTIISQSIAPGTLIEPFKAISIVVTALDETGGSDSKIFNITALGTPISITAKAGPLKFNLDPVTGKKTLTLADIATINNPLDIKYSTDMQPTTFDCSLKGQQTVTVTAAGGISGKPGSAGLRSPVNIALDRAGNFYITDNVYNKVKKITTMGDVITLAGNYGRGSNDGTGLEASFNQPFGIAVDKGGNVFVADYANDKIRKINVDGVVSTFAGNGTYFDLNHFGTNAGIDNPMSVATDELGNVYFTQTDNLIRKISPEGMVTAFAGSGSGYGSWDGVGASAGINGNGHIFCDQAGNVFLTDRYDGKIRKITPAGVVSTLPTTVSLIDVKGIALDKSGLIYVVLPSGNYGGKILKFNQSGTLLQTMLPTASLVYWSPEDLVVDDLGNVFVTDVFNHSIQKFTPDGMMTTFAGTLFSDDIDGNIGFKQENTVSLQIPVNILSVPVFKGTYPDQNVSADASANITLPDYTRTANAVDFCSNGALAVSQLPAAGTLVKSGDLVTLTATNGDGNSTSVTFKVWTVPVPTITAGGPISFNPGGNVLLTANPSTGYSYQWKQGGVVLGPQTTANYTAVLSGSYTVTISLGTVSQTSAPIIVTVIEPAPTFAEIRPSTAATGTTVDIYGSYFTAVSKVTFGGVAPTSYKVVSANLITAVIGSGASGKVEVVTATGSGSIGGFVYVPVPIVTASTPTNFTSGGSVVLTANALTGYTYQWKKDGVDISGATSNSYTATTTGNYVLSITMNGVSQVSAGTAVNVTPLPVNNFKLTASSITCRGANNGSINIMATSPLNYTAVISKDGITTTQTFNGSTTFSNLVPGSYGICISPALNPTDVQCFTLQLTEPKDLAVYTGSIKDKTVTLSLSGANVYHVTLNGTTYTTAADELTLALSNGNNVITVTSDLACQGKVEKNILVGDTPLVYPNPFDHILNVSTGSNYSPLVKVSVYALDGKLVHSSSYTNVKGVIQLDLATLQTGLYVLKLAANNSETVFKLIKK